MSKGKPCCHPATALKPVMVMVFKECGSNNEPELDTMFSHFACGKCGTDLTNAGEIISK